MRDMPGCRPHFNPRLTSLVPALALALATFSACSSPEGGTSARVNRLLANMTLEEKIGMLHGVTDPDGPSGAGYLAGVPRLGVPPLRLADGPAGIRTREPATALPAPVALATAFDPALARRYGQLMGREGRARNQDVLLAPMVNIVRVPGAGRNFEALGEDPLLAARMVAEEVAGVEGEGLIATIKHDAANSFENGRQQVNAEIDERTLHEIYLPGFEAAVKAGVGSIMCAYNKVNGAYACENPELLNRVARDAWGFAGWVMSDWGATHSAAPALEAGLDMEMPRGRNFESLLGGGGFGGGASLLPTADGLRNATAVVSMRAGERRAFELTATAGDQAPMQLRLAWVTPAARAARIAEAEAAALGAKAAIVFAHDEGTEGRDRASLSLSTGQDDLVAAVAAANPRTIVVLETGHPVLMPWAESVAAILQMWYPGEDGADATAALLAGEASPGGRLPVTFPRRAEDAPTSPVERYPGVDDRAVYSEGILVGYRWYDAQDVAPLFAFGHGLSYARFTYAGLRVTPADDGLDVSVTVTNAGAREGTEVAQVYVGPPDAPPVPMAPRALAGFARLSLAPGASRTVTVHVGAHELSYWSVEAHDWVVAASRRAIEVGASSRDIRLRTDADIPPR